MMQRALLGVISILGTAVLGHVLGVWDALLKRILGDNFSERSAENIHAFTILIWDHPWSSWPIPFALGVLIGGCAFFLFHLSRSREKKRTWQQLLGDEAYAVSIQFKLDSRGLSRRELSAVNIARYDRLSSKLKDKAELELPEVFQTSAEIIIGLLDTISVYLRDNDLIGLKAKIAKLKEDSGDK